MSLFLNHFLHLKEQSVYLAKQIIQGAAARAGAPVAAGAYSTAHHAAAKVCVADAGTACPAGQQGGCLVDWGLPSAVGARREGRGACPMLMLLSILRLLASARCT